MKYKVWSDMDNPDQPHHIEADTPREALDFYLRNHGPTLSPGEQFDVTVSVDYYIECDEEVEGYECIEVPYLVSYDHE